MEHQSSPAPPPPPRKPRPRAGASADVPFACAAPARARLALDTRAQDAAARAARSNFTAAHALALAQRLGVTALPTYRAYRGVLFDVSTLAQEAGAGGGADGGGSDGGLAAVDAHGNTPLHAAGRRGHSSLFAALAEAGAAARRANEDRMLGRQAAGEHRQRATLRGGSPLRGRATSPTAHPAHGA